ncbi:MAG: recombinase family protein [Pirellulaceae bacterium]
MAVKGQMVGYIRVSTVDQNIDRQLEQIQADRLFVDRVSGKDLARPELRALINYVREGDMIVVASMDRLARNVDDLRRIVAEQTKRGVGVRFIKENLTFTGEDSPMANMLLSVLGAVAQFERDLIRERQREGIEIAKKKGKFRGRKRALTEQQILDAQRRIAAGETKASVARALGVSRDTLYRSLDVSS